MMGQYERLLNALVAAPRYNSADDCDSIAHTLDSAAESWSHTARQPGWTGISAEAASWQFHKQASDCSEQAQLMRRARDIITEANQVLETAGALLAALPEATINESVGTAIQAGLSIAIPGFGAIATALDYFILGRQLQEERENAAQTAYQGIQSALNNLSYELTNLQSNSVITSIHPVTYHSEKDGKPSLNDILTDYQVEDDPNGTTEWNLKGFNRWIAEQLGMAFPDQILTSGEGDLLDELDIFGQKDFRDIHDLAFTESQERYAIPTDENGVAIDNSDINDNHVDAYRHAYWNALMAKRYGAGWASMYGTAHEGIESNTSRREAMDLYNNEVGREIYKNNPLASDEKLAELIQDAVENGEMVVIDQNGELDWSSLDRDKTGHPEGDVILDGRPGQDFHDESLS